MNRCFQRPGLSLCLCRLQSPVALSHHRKRPEELPQLLPPTHHSTHSRFTDFTASLCLRTISGPLYPRPWRRPSCITRVVKLNSRSDERQTRNQCVWSLEFEVGVWICWLPFAACRCSLEVGAKSKPRDSTKTETRSAGPPAALAAASRLS